MPDIEHKKRVIKDRARALIIISPFKNIPGRTIIELIRFVGIWLNQELYENGVSDVYSPQNIFMVQDLAFEKHCKFRLRYYVYDHDYHNITNNTEEQKVSGICLGPTAKFQGSCKIFSLKTGRVVTRNQKIKEIQIPSWVIQLIEALDMRDRQDLAENYEPLFVERFSNKNYFDATLHKGGIAGVAQDDRNIIMVMKIATQMNTQTALME